MESCVAVGTRNSIIIPVTPPPAPYPPPPEDILIKELPADLWAHFQSRNLSHLSLIAPARSPLPWDINMYTAYPPLLRQTAEKNSPESDICNQVPSQLVFQASVTVHTYTATLLVKSLW
jgi:hypothetical protein